MTTPSKMALATAARHRPMPGSVPAPTAILHPSPLPAKPGTFPQPAISNTESVVLRQAYDAPPRNPTIYQDLMKKHDRMTQRHLPRT